MRKALQVSLVALAFALAAHAAEAAPLPDLSGVTSGKVTITPPPNGSTTMAIRQTTDAAAIDWKSFSIDSGYTVSISQPKASSLLINRVTGSAMSRIDGTLTATGQVFLVNPNGITIGKTGKVAAGGFLASTLGLTGKDGAYTLANSAKTPKPVTVDGSVTAGYVVLAGGDVRIPGTITATSVALAAGSGATLKTPMNGSTLDLSVTKNAANAVIDIGGSLKVTNGKLVIDAGSLADAAVNVDGAVTANGSEVSIIAGRDANGAALRVGHATTRDIFTKAPGEITFTGARVKNRLTINGRTYTLLWDVNDVKAINSTGLNGDYALARDIDFKNAGPFTDMLIGTTSGRTTTVFSGRLNGLGHDLSNVRINGSGQGDFVGPIGILSGYLGNIGFANVTVNTLVRDHYLKVGGAAGAVSGHMRNVFVSGAISGGYGNIGGLTGLLLEGATITSSAVDATVQPTVAPKDTFSSVGGLVGTQDPFTRIDGSRSMGIVRGAVLPNGPGTIGEGIAGGLVGTSEGLIRNSSSTATVEGGTFIGGIAGVVAFTGRIEDSAYVGDVRSYDVAVATYVGGLVGDLQGTIDRSTARGSVTGAAYWNVGGLVGVQRQDLFAPESAPSIVNSSFVGVVSGGANSLVGGLVGSLELGRIQKSWANATVQGGKQSSVGGLVGEHISPDLLGVLDSYAAGVVTGGNQSQVGGLAGLVDKGSSIAGSYSAATVTSGWGSNTGGVAGRNLGAIAWTYAMGSVNGGAKGGLVGYQDSTGRLDNSVYVQSPGLEAIGGGATSQQGQVKALTLKELTDGAKAQIYLGTTYFTYAKGKRPKLKWEP